MKKTTLTFVLNGELLLMIFKKRGQGAGKWNFPGGKIAPGESEVEAAAREVLEETGIFVGNLEKRGSLEFRFPAGGSWSNSCSVFLARSFSGSLVAENEECSAHWVPLSEVPYEKMWPNDRLWVPALLSGKMVNRIYTFDEKDSMVCEEVMDDV